MPATLESVPAYRVFADHSASDKQGPATNSVRHGYSSGTPPQQCVLPASAEWGISSQQRTSQLSTSPSAFSFASMPANETSPIYGTCLLSNLYCSVPPTMHVPSDTFYIPPIYPKMVTSPIGKGEFINARKNGFDMDHASIVSVNVSSSGASTFAGFDCGYLLLNAQPNPYYARS